MKPRLIIVCNALEDATRLERGITTDSPAASRKVFMMCRTLRDAGIQTWIVSLGRGRQNGSGSIHMPKLVRTERCTIIYLPFVHLPLFSQVLSFLYLPLVIRKFAFRAGSKVLFYNRMNAYLAGLIACRAFDLPAFLDIEDGEAVRSGWLRKKISQFVIGCFQHTCKEGALLACSALKPYAGDIRTQCYYGVVESTASGAIDWESGRIHFLLGGTISHATGANSLLSVLKRIRADRPNWASSVAFEITGKGELLEEFSAYENCDLGGALLKVHGRVTDHDYKNLLKKCHAGLALKPASGELANTTFPSKVAELAAAGLLVITTDISDVRRIFGSAAVYVDSTDPESLFHAIGRVVSHRAFSAATAIRGHNCVSDHCDPRRTAAALKEFFFASEVIC